MKENPSAKLFKEPAKWPVIPPWWLISSTEAAALLNIKPATLHSWRIRGEGPEPFPPMYLKPTQGRPLYYRYSILRSWAASRLGMSYTLDDQCMDFFRNVCPILCEGSGSLRGQIDTFERLFTQDRKRILKGELPTLIKDTHIHALDVFYSRQPIPRGNGLVLRLDPDKVEG